MSVSARRILLSVGLLLAAGRAAANPLLAPSAPGMLGVEMIALLIVGLSWFSGGRAIQRALGENPWGPLKILPVLFFAPFISPWGALSLGFFALYRASELVRWGLAARNSDAAASHLAGASPRRLIICGAILGVLGPLLAFGALQMDFHFSPINRALTEGGTKGALGGLRAGVSEKGFPTDLEALQPLPKAKLLYYHPSSARVRYARDSDDSGGWLYDRAGGEKFARIAVNCTHTDSKGVSWTSY